MDDPSPTWEPSAAPGQLLEDVDVALSTMRPMFAAMFEPASQLVKALNPDEAPEFAAGLREILHRAVEALIQPEPDEHAFTQWAQELIAYYESWTLTTRLAANAEWLRQMAESRAEPITAANLVTLDELHRRLSA